jgi:putative hydrolase of the HAD superfamily
MSAMPKNSLSRPRPRGALEPTGTNFDLIAFDGDDTLWHNERVYRMGRDRFREVLARVGVLAPDEEIEERVNQIELRNLKYYGYGVMSFVLSLIEASIELTEGRISGADIQALLDLSREMLTAEIELFDGAMEAVAALAADYPLMLITKGDLLHQRAKVEQSGLGEHFHFVEVVSTKNADTYTSILARHAIAPGRFLMVGNSLRSDVVPVLDLGGWAVHIPARLSWAHEDSEPPVNATGRFFGLEALRDLPALVRTLNT